MGAPTVRPQTVAAVCDCGFEERKLVPDIRLVVAALVWVAWLEPSPIRPKRR